MPSPIEAPPIAPSLRRASYTPMSDAAPYIVTFNRANVTLDTASPTERAPTPVSGQGQNVVAQEFEHRLINSLQIVTSLLSIQARASTDPHVAEQLSIAANRVATIGRVQRQLHKLDQQADVDIKVFLSGLCDELSQLLLPENNSRSIRVEGAHATFLSELAIPLGFIVNELITNAVKYGSGDIVIGLAVSPQGLHALSVTDDGPGLPNGLDPTQGKSLGMKIVASLARQFGGEVRIGPLSDGRMFLTLEF
jgi:two-component system, sensor histidine kinase PdtaS